MRGAVKQSIRNHVASLVFGLSPVLKKAADAVTELSIGYPESPLNGGGQHLHRGPLAGERAPIREKELPVGAGATPRFALFAQSSGETVKQLAARYANCWSRIYENHSMQADFASCVPMLTWLSRRNKVGGMR